MTPAGEVRLPDDEERAWAEAVVQALPDPVLLIDGELFVMAGNAAVFDLLARDEWEVVGQELAALLVSADADAVRSAGSAMLDGHVLRSSSGIVLGDGSQVPVSIELRPLLVAGRVQGALVLLLPPPAPAAFAGLPPREPAAAVDLAAELADALRGEEIILHYQPIVELTEQRPVAAEALVRWEHPRRGLLSPSEFLALVDTPALALALGSRVVREACHAASRWGTLGTEPAVRVSVNLSERQLLQPGTVELVRRALGVATCPPERLILEVGEGALRRDPETARAALHALKDLGVAIAVDDIGRGAGPLTYLTGLPADLLKIDRGVVADLGADPEQRSAAERLVSVAHARGARCVAEGVETAEQLALLRDVGCDFGQGYLFTRALNHSAATDWLSRAASARGATAGAGAIPGSSSQTLQRALEMQSQGMSLHTIAARLNAEGHRKTGGRRWQHTSIAQLIAAHPLADSAG
jgi:EAL domain-containing protein (putative c-di-GMP-specific phosphodiesterase class I)